MKTKSINKLITNSILSGVLALGVGTTSAFANETTQPSTTGAIPAATVTATEQSTLSVLPADYFYLFKTIVIKIEIALTDDEVKQAKLHAVITQERIKRAEVLITEGKTELAVETLQQAWVEQDQEIEEASDASEEELKDHLRHNIEALTLALEKVKNPKAKAALARNIEKSKAKLSVAIEEPDETDEQKTEVTEIKVQLQAKPVKSEESEDDDDEKAEDGQENDDKDSDDRDEDSKAIHEKLKTERKAAHEKYKQEKKDAHEQAKQERKGTHENGKEDHKH